MWGEAKPGWRQARPCGGVATVFIKLKPKGGREQVLRTCRSSPDHEQSRRSLDRRRRRTGWRREFPCCSPLVPRPSALQASPAEAEGPQRRLCRRPQPALGATAGDAGGGRAIATGGEVQLAPLSPLQRAVTPAEVASGGPLPAPGAPRRAAAVAVVVVVAAVAGALAVVAAPTPARPQPAGSLIAPRQASGAEVAGSSPYESAVSATASASLSASAALEQSIGTSGPRSAASLLLFVRPPGISKHTDVFGSNFNFEFSTRSNPGSEFRIAYCMQARSISAP